MRATNANLVLDIERYPGFSPKGYFMAERYTGQVQNGLIVLGQGTPSLPEGTKVRVEPTDMKAALKDISAGLRKLAGRAEGLPEDMAENLDHYLHGHPKR